MRPEQVNLTAKIVVKGQELKIIKDEEGMDVAVVELESDIIPYKIKIDAPNLQQFERGFDCFIVYMTIDGKKKVQNNDHLLGFAPLKIVENGNLSRQEAEQIGKIELVIRNAKQVGYRARKRDDRGGISSEKTVTEGVKKLFSVHSVSAGKLTTLKKKCNTKRGSFHRKITLLYADLRLLELRGLIAPVTVPPVLKPIEPTDILTVKKEIAAVKVKTENVNH